MTILVTGGEIELQTTPFNLSTQDISRVQAMLDKYQAILKAPFTPDKDLLELNADYPERLEAIDLHAQIRQEQGRPV